MVHWMFSDFIHKQRRCSLTCFIINTLLLLEVHWCYEVWNPLAPCGFTGKITKQALREYQNLKAHTLNAAKSSRQRNLWLLKKQKNHSFGPSVPQHSKRKDGETMTVNLKQLQMFKKTSGSSKKMFTSSFMIRNHLCANLHRHPNRHTLTYMHSFRNLDPDLYHKQKLLNSSFHTTHTHQISLNVCRLVMLGRIIQRNKFGLMKTQKFLQLHRLK